MPKRFQSPVQGLFHALLCAIFVSFTPAIGIYLFTYGFIGFLFSIIAFFIIYFTFEVKLFTKKFPVYHQLLYLILALEFFYLMHSHSYGTRFYLRLEDAIPQLRKDIIASGPLGHRHASWQWNEQDDFPFMPEYSLVYDDSSPYLPAPDRPANMTEIHVIGHFYLDVQ